MILAPTNPAELSAQLAGAFKTGTPVSGVDLDRLGRVVEYAPEDMTITVEGGLPLRTLQTQLRAHGQWLPIDPPEPRGVINIARLINENLSGPKRYGYGTIREYLLGLRVALADGQIIRSGGRVVKNVAGYDLAKLFVGGRGTLGVIVEATLKLLPVPPEEQQARIDLPDLAAVDATVRLIKASALTPVIFDLHNLSPPAGGSFPCSLVLGFAGTSPEVAWQMSELGAKIPFEKSTLEYETQFWGHTPGPGRLAVLPSNLTQHLPAVGRFRFVARAGNGIIYYDSPEKIPAPPARLPTLLLRRVKELFDPKGIFPPLTL